MTGAGVLALVAVLFAFLSAAGLCYWLDRKDQKDLERARTSYQYKGKRK